MRKAYGVPVRLSGTHSKHRANKQKNRAGNPLCPVYISTQRCAFCCAFFNTQIAGRKIKNPLSLAGQRVSLELLSRFELETSSLPITPFTCCGFSQRPQTVAITGFPFRRLCISPPSGVTFHRISPQIHPKPSPSTAAHMGALFYALAGLRICISVPDILYQNQA